MPQNTAPCRSFAADPYCETTNILVTQKGLGYANLVTTQIYTHFFCEKLEGALKSSRAAKGAS